MDTELIKKVIIKKTGIDLNDPEQVHTRKRENVTARKLYCKFCREYTTKSLSDIGKTFTPPKDHATVLHNVRTIEDIIKFDRTLRDKAESIQTLLEYIRAKELYGEEDIETKVALLAKSDMIIDALQEQNNKLAQQLEDLHNKVERQNRYLEEQGYKVNMSVFKDL